MTGFQNTTFGVGQLGRFFDLKINAVTRRCENEMNLALGHLCDWEV